MTKHKIQDEWATCCSCHQSSYNMVVGDKLASSFRKVLGMELRRLHRLSTHKKQQPFILGFHRIDGQVISVHLDKLVHTVPTVPRSGPLTQLLQWLQIFIAEFDVSDTWPQGKKPLMTAKQIFFGKYDGCIN